MSHHWVVDDDLWSEGELLETPLAAGAHTIRLTTLDARGAFDHAMLAYDRQCR